MNVLVGCEYSGRVREAFRKLGHEAYSCDLLESEDNSKCHIRANIFDVIDNPAKYTQGRVEKWNKAIFHPPCTDLAVSGSRWFPEKIADGRQAAAIDFFMRLADCDIEQYAIENPICIMSSKWRKPDQIIQPWQFGHGETKATCLWLKGFPPLVPTNIVEGREAKVHRMPPGPNRWKERSRTYQGIADAMALQWGGLIPTECKGCLNMGYLHERCCYP